MSSSFLELLDLIYRKVFLVICILAGAQADNGAMLFTERIPGDEVKIPTDISFNGTSQIRSQCYVGYWIMRGKSSVQSWSPFPPTFAVPTGGIASKRIVIVMS